MIQPGPIRVLDLRDTYEIGGPGKTILETFKSVDPREFELHLGVFLGRHESADSPFIRAAREIGMPVHLIGGDHPFDPRLISRTASLIRRLGIHVVHSHEVKSDVIAYLASFATRTRIVTTLHGWIANSPKQRLLTALGKRVARRFDRVIVVSDLMRREMAAAGVQRDRMRMVHNGVVLDRYRRTGQNGFLAELVGHPVPGPVLASIGRFSAEKGHADLIEALALVAARGHEASLVLVGEGPERSRLEARIQQLGLGRRVFLPGYVDRPARVLEDVDLVVLPSHTEGLPNVALEAMAMGVPVLATRVGGTPEVITDGQSGRLVPPRSPDALADAIVDFVAHRESWALLARRGREVVEQSFDFRARTRQMERIYRELAVLRGAR